MDLCVESRSLTSLPEMSGLGRVAVTAASSHARISSLLKYGCFLRKNFPIFISTCCNAFNCVAALVALSPPCLAIPSSYLSEYEVSLGSIALKVASKRFDRCSLG